MIDHFNVEFFHDSMIFVVHMNLCLDCTFFFTSYSKINMIYEVCFKLCTHISNDYKIYVNAQKNLECINS